MNFDAYTVLTFDCYGTLIDWETGLTEALQPVFANHAIQVPVGKALELYGELETEAERGEYRDYKTVLQTALTGMGARLGFAPTPAELARFSESVRDWPAFPDSARALQALKTKYKLAVISNIDDELFAASARRLQVSFDWVVTAQQVQSYKPSHNNFLKAWGRIGQPKERIVHVAQSLYHDIAPGKALGVATVWVNRRHGQDGTGATPPAEAQPELVVPDLQSLTKLIGVL